MKSIKKKLVIVYLALVFIVMIVSGTFIIMRTKDVEVKNKKDELIYSVERVVEEVINKYEESDFQIQLDSQYSGGNTYSSQIHVNILNSLGETIASNVSSNPYPTYKNSDIIAALAGTTSFSYGNEDTDSRGLKNKWMNYAYPIKDNNSVKYVVFVRTNINTMIKNLNTTTKTISIAVILALALGGIIGYIFANTLTGPIIELTKGAKELAEGNFDKQIEVYSNDEIGQLTSNFNYMANELNKTMHTISGEKNKLETVLHNMTDGILAYDNKGNLIHANPATSTMLDMDEIPTHISNFIESFKLGYSVEELLSVDEDLIYEHILDINEKYTKLNIAPYFSEQSKVEGLIVVLQDITKQKKLDDMRREFVANVSHELRTPLTTIKSYAETLLDGAMEEMDIAKEFLEIIDSEADRMALLVTDLLHLSRFDNKQFKLKYQVASINSLLKNCWQQHKILADKKNHTYKYIPLEKDIEVNIDVDRISQVLSNIITNSIKYSPDNSNILISTDKTDKHIKIIIEDNGIGIPKDDLGRIFERFYRVDKARSRAMGGTGLGLAISKEIMELHGGMITAESIYEKGTTMTLWIPKNI